MHHIADRLITVSDDEWICEAATAESSTNLDTTSDGTGQTLGPSTTAPR